MFTLLAIIVPLIPLRGIVVPADHQGYLRFIDQAAELGSASDLSSKQYVGLFYSYVEAVMPYWVFTNVVLVVYLYYATLAIRTLSAYLVALIVTLPMFSHFNYVSKEAILAFVAVLAMLATLAFGKRSGQVTLVVGLVLFAIFVRPYYAIPLVGTALVAFLGLKRGLWVALAAFAGVMFFYTEPLEALEASRQQMYRASLYSFGTRTVYPNVWVGGDAPLQLQVVANYFIVLAETLVPVSWTLTLKDIYAQVFVVAIIVLAVGALKTSDRLVAIFGILLVLTVPFFSPDLGTSMRHIAAAAFYLHLGIALQRVYEGRPLAFRPLELRPIYPFPRRSAI